MKDKILGFINEMNHELHPFAFITEWEKYPDSLTFQMHTFPSKYFSGGILNTNEKYEKLVKRKVKKFFKETNITFNNTGWIFWFKKENYENYT